MNVYIKKSKLRNHQKVQITGSKSESNRLLLLQALYPQLQIQNLSNSDDSVLMQKAVSTKDKLVDIHHAGTAMRFLTAYFSIQKNREVILTGSSRMKERPIKILVDALNSLGADIRYLENEGYPPLKIVGRDITNNKVTLEANVSSQYISALLLIASKLENGLELTLKGEITSMPYIQMTLSLLREIGIETNFINNVISVKPCSSTVSPQILTVESDWSSASYFYSIIALSAVGTEITISSYKNESLQGDSALVSIYKNFGVETTFLDNSICLQKVETNDKNSLKQFDLRDAPDIAQTIAVTSFGLGKECQLTGLHTLKIKETDRLVALKNELEKLGAQVIITNDSLQLKPSDNIKQEVSISTYNDHRMAMAFAPLGLLVPIEIKNAEVVSKSYPDFWKDLKRIGFDYNKI